MSDFEIDYSDEYNALIEECEKFKLQKEQVSNRGKVAEAIPKIIDPALLAKLVSDFPLITTLDPSSDELFSGIETDITDAIEDSFREIQRELEKYQGYLDILKIQMAELTSKETCKEIERSRPEEIQGWKINIKNVLSDMYIYQQELDGFYNGVMINRLGKGDVNKILDPCGKIPEQHGGFVPASSCPNPKIDPIGYIECMLGL